MVCSILLPVIGLMTLVKVNWPSEFILTLPVGSLTKVPLHPIHRVVARTTVEAEGYCPPPTPTPPDAPPPPPTPTATTTPRPGSSASPTHPPQGTFRPPDTSQGTMEEEAATCTMATTTTVLMCTAGMEEIMGVWTERNYGWTTKTEGAIGTEEVWTEEVPTTLAVPTTIPPGPATNPHFVVFTFCEKMDEKRTTSTTKLTQKVFLNTIFTMMLDWTEINLE